LTFTYHGSPYVPPFPYVYQQVFLRFVPVSLQVSSHVGFISDPQWLKPESS